MIANIGKIVWRNDKTAARSIGLWDVVLAAIGTMAVLAALGGVLLLVGAAFNELSLIWFRYLLGFGYLFAVSPLLSWFGFIFGSAGFLIAARCGAAGWLSTTLLGAALATLVYFPFFRNDIHPVVLMLCGALNAMTFWVLMKGRRSDALIAPQSTRLSS
ncbi:hypothetical protein DSW25_16445 [Sulfitobacter donghicola DSW-25 = KCTC 12864 = JCM 14565]|uniref:Uncharacterized protein n=1 Tax=Sulfitobacter donghicola DSW-25 = KCTC 12864 = JCM 14565 TaxID=1300350 RepID=A0A073IES2_9RHOB|nr:hypothetical protein DSW25_16445 [Sulfitobacter donghicola DSW-25 = KCTC 12864 = JCM 14565]